MQSRHAMAHIPLALLKFATNTGKKGKIILFSFGGLYCLKCFFCTFGWGTLAIGRTESRERHRSSSFLLLLLQLLFMNTYKLLGNKINPLKKESTKIYNGAQSS